LLALVLLQLVKAEQGNAFARPGSAYRSLFKATIQPGGAVLFARIPLDDVINLAMGIECCPGFDRVMTGIQSDQ